MNVKRAATQLHLRYRPTLYLTATVVCPQSVAALGISGGDSVSSR